MTARRPALPYPFAVALTCVAVGVLLALCDRYAHVGFGVLSYANVPPGGQAWWAWPNFLGAATGMYFGAKYSVARQVSWPSAARLAFNAACFVAAYFASGLFAAWPGALLAGLLLAWCLRLAFTRDRLPVAIFSVVLVVMGVGIEGAETLTGGFAYRDPQFFHVPYWLAALYMNGAFLALDVVRKVEGTYQPAGIVPS